MRMVYGRNIINQMLLFSLQKYHCCYFLIMNNKEENFLPDDPGRRPGSGIQEKVR
jgi:hypothetical protein